MKVLNSIFNKENNEPHKVFEQCAQSYVFHKFDLSLILGY